MTDKGRGFRHNLVFRRFGVGPSAIINYAMRLDMVGRSPCRGINLPKVAPVRRHVIDAAELARLAKALGGVERYGPMVYLGAAQGLRWGEVAGFAGERGTRRGTPIITIIRPLSAEWARGLRRRALPHGGLLRLGRSAW